MTSSMTKLLHLQGLRAVAILAVIAFHFFPKQCKNGYLGVDMFFLLSGFLMTMMLDRLKTVSIPELLNFWYRRFKRILPFYYLTIFGIMSVLFASNGMVRSANVDPALHATILATNLIAPSGEDGYFEKLGIAVDMFTHTWSLALEMQFYLIFPVIFILINYPPSKLKLLATFSLGVSSLFFHISSDEFHAFNSVLSRIWQFLAGTVAFYAEDWLGKAKTRNCDEEEDLISTITESPYPTNTALINIVIFTLLALFAIPQEVAPLYARINTILISFLIVAYGKNSCLEHRLLVFIGEISYGWYLVHWPVYALLKIHKLTDSMHLLGGIVFSFLLAVVLHYMFEKQYLSWSKATVFLTVFVLLIANGTAVFWMKSMVETRDEQLPVINDTVPNGLPKDLDKRFFYPSDFLDGIVYGFENKTAEERIELNKQYNSGDAQRTRSFCKNPIKTDNRKEFRCEMNELANKTANATLLLMGNSWAANVMKPLTEACSHRFSHLEIVSESGCESLFPAPRGDSYACELDYMFVEGVKRVKPDVLVLFNRYSDSTKLENGTSPFNDFTFKEAVKQLKEYEKYTKKQILIVDALPWPKQNIVGRMTDLLEGKKVEEQEDVSFDIRYFTVKQRIQRVISGCKKCKIFDISNQFWFDGKFKLHDPKYLVSFMSWPLHLTPAGWTRIKPLLKYMCDSV